MWEHWQNMNVGSAYHLLPKSTFYIQGMKWENARNGKDMGNANMYRRTTRPTCNYTIIAPTINLCFNSRKTCALLHHNISVWQGATRMSSIHLKAWKPVIHSNPACGWVNWRIWVSPQRRKSCWLWPSSSVGCAQDQCPLWGLSWESCSFASVEQGLGNRPNTGS